MPAGRRVCHTLPGGQAVRSILQARRLHSLNSNSRTCGITEVCPFFSATGYANSVTNTDQTNAQASCCCRKAPQTRICDLLCLSVSMLHLTTLSDSGQCDVDCT
jgi:hypothetical protein